MTRREIEGLKGNNRRILQGKFFGLIFQKSAGENKFALIVSNKIAAKAFKRNKIKRLFFEAVRNGFLNEEGKYLFLAKKPSAEASLDDLKWELEEFRRKL